jgi:hypothetical protein
LTSTGGIGTEINLGKVRGNTGACGLGFTGATVLNGKLFLRTIASDGTVGASVDIGRVEGPGFTSLGFSGSDLFVEYVPTTGITFKVNLGSAKGTTLTVKGQTGFLQYYEGNDLQSVGDYRVDTSRDRLAVPGISLSQSIDFGDGSTLSSAPVKTINGLSGFVGLSAGLNITITPTGNTFVVSCVIPTGTTGSTGPTGATGSTGAGFTGITQVGGDLFVSVLSFTGGVGPSINLGRVRGNTGATGATGPVGDYVTYVNGRTGGVTFASLAGILLDNFGSFGATSTINIGTVTTNLKGTTAARSLLMKRGTTHGYVTELTNTDDLYYYTANTIGTYSWLVGVCGLYLRGSTNPNQSLAISNHNSILLPTNTPPVIYSINGIVDLFNNAPAISGVTTGIRLNSDDGIGGAYSGLLTIPLLSTNQSYALPDASGTIALLSNSQTFTAQQRFNTGIISTGGTYYGIQTFVNGATFQGNIVAPNIVTSVNGRTGGITFYQGTNITLTVAAAGITIDSAGGGSGITTTAANTFTAVQSFSAGIISTGGTYYGIQTFVNGATFSARANFVGGLCASGGVTLSGQLTGVTASFSGLITSTAGFSGTGITLSGNLSAATKSFVIPHPTKPGMQLQYGSLEGPENGVYVRGKVIGSDIITLPDYWIALVDPETITVNLTGIGSASAYFVEYSTPEYIKIGTTASKIHCYYTVYAERKDVPKLNVEY